VDADELCGKVAGHNDTYLYLLSRSGGSVVDFQIHEVEIIINKIKITYRGAVPVTDPPAVLDQSTII
jgi:hypothetical protein